MFFKSRRNTDDTSPVEAAPLVLTTAPKTGLFKGTRVGTPDKWALVEDLKPGDMVLTAEQGMQEITGIKRGELSVHKTLAAARQWPLHVPEGALGDNAAMLISPHMRLVVDDEAAGLLFGERCVSVRAEALIGYRGIARASDANALSHVLLEFEQSVTLVLEGGGVLDMAGPTGTYRFTPLSDRQSRLLIRHMGETDRLHRSGGQVAEGCWG